MRHASLLFAAILVLAAQPTTAQKLLQQKDKFSGATAYFTELRESKLEGGSFISGRYVSMRFEAYSPVSDASAPYGIFVRTQTPTWVFISAGPSLILKLDGQELLTLMGTGSKDARTVISGDMVSELAYWPMSETQLARIAQAKRVEFRILGDQQTLTGQWKDDLIRDAVYFASEMPKVLHPEAAVTALLVEAAKADGQQNCPNAVRSPALGPPVKMGALLVSVTKPVADLLHLPAASGMFVLQVKPGSPAESSGIKAGDVVTKFGDTPVPGKCEFFGALALASADAVRLAMLRQQGTNWESWSANVQLRAEPASDVATGPPLAPATSNGTQKDVYTELLKLDELRKKGILSDAEFNAQKQKLLNGN
jgi:hypothetical protein